MAKGSSYAVPATPSRGEDRADYDSTPGTEDLVTTGRSVSFEDTEFDHDAKDEDDYVDDELEGKAPVQEPDLYKDADMFVTKSDGVKSLSRNLADEFEVADKPEPVHDDIDELNDDLKKSSTMTRGASQLTTKKDGNRPPINGDTPVANKTLGQCLNAMLDTSSWIQLFAPKAARQAAWAELVEGLSHPVNSTSTSQVAEDTVSLLMAMGMEAHAYPSSAALADWTASEAGTELQR
ncbi:Eukaryotic/viral aspartic protease [Phytophthora megakarya]|uniref:Eukaryotic/viral aspartic protease n=1 Tax=Phytophthora megakarya TaxID=4795 RepID=A0A225VHT5_9STRA|nr:Eukaryotic/viral aspartic protease [Phytophthora megakarya]